MLNCIVNPANGVFEDALSTPIVTLQRATRRGFGRDLAAVWSIARLDRNARIRGETNQPDPAEGRVGPGVHRTSAKPLPPLRRATVQRVAELADVNSRRHKVRQDMTHWSAGGGRLRKGSST